jgi:hypothetical protein
LFFIGKAHWFARSNTPTSTIIIIIKLFATAALSLLSAVVVSVDHPVVHGFAFPAMVHSTFLVWGSFSLVRRLLVDWRLALFAR